MRYNKNGEAWNQNLVGLLEAVDGFEGKPRKRDIRRLAKKYGDTEFMVRHCFEHREDRMKANAFKAARKEARDG